MRLLFRAVYKNGDIYDQTPDDKARVSDWGTCFTDIEQAGIEDLKFFILRDWSLNEGKGADLYVVNCETGEFMVNGCAFDIIDRTLPIDKVELFYDRTREIQQTTDLKGNVLGQADMLCCYNLGVKVFRGETETRHIIRVY